MAASILEESGDILSMSPACARGTPKRRRWRLALCAVQIRRILWTSTPRNILRMPTAMMVGGLKLNFRIGFARSPRPMTYMNSFTQACRFLGPLWEDSQRESAYQHPKVSTEGQRPRGERGEQRRHHCCHDHRSCEGIAYALGWGTSGVNARRGGHVRVGSWLCKRVAPRTR